MGKSGLIRRGINYLRNYDIDIRTRMLFLMEYATFFACFLGTIPMLFFADSIYVLIPNFALMAFSGLGIFFSHVKKNYTLAINLIVIGCAYISLPIMFFTAGGNMSGMPIWFVFGVVFSCLMTRGKSRIIMPAIDILICAACMLTGYLFPDFVMPLANHQAEFIDMIQSYVLVCIMICACLIVYLSTYDKQRTLLEQQRRELSMMMNMDALTGISNRRAYYERSNYHSVNGYQKDIVVLAMDVNGLKKVNDTLGHSAGDAMIKSAANIAVKAFSNYGYIFRTGGDEFMAILTCSDDIASNLDIILTDTINNSSEESEKSISMAIGVAIWNEDKNLNFTELEKLADSRMYKNKNEYYVKSGINRRKS